MKFDLGNVVATRGAMLNLAPIDILKAIARHGNGDWGNLCKEDKQLNDQSLLDGDGRLLSAYTSSNGVKFWIITEADRSVTTVLLPEEY